MILTAQQEDRLDTLSDGNVVGAENDSLIVRYPSGQLMRICPDGRVRAASMRTYLEIGRRQRKWHERP